MAVRRSGAESANSHSLPEAEEVWKRVATYARDCLNNDRPVFTVSRNVGNRITDVTEGSIGRVSAQGGVSADLLYGFGQIILQSHDGPMCAFEQKETVLTERCVTTSSQHDKQKDPTPFGACRLA